MKYVSLSQVIKAAANYNTPPPGYYNTFLSSYKAYHKKQNVRRTVWKVIKMASVIIVACMYLVVILYK